MSEVIQSSSTELSSGSNEKPTRTIKLAPSKCYDRFLDVMKCQTHVANIMQLSKRAELLQLNEPNLKLTSICHKALHSYLQCIPKSSPTDYDTEEMRQKYTELLKQVYVVNDLRYYHVVSSIAEDERKKL